VCVCVWWKQEDRLDDPPSPGDGVEPASRGEAAITTSWALSGRWPTLYSTRPATLTDRQRDRGRAWRTVRQAGAGTKDTACEYFNSGLNARTRRPAAEKLKKTVGVIGQRRSGVSGFIWGLTSFKTNLRPCGIVLLTKFLTRSARRFIVLLKETCCPAKGRLMVFQTHSITLMYCRSKDKTTTCADEGGWGERLWSAGKIWDFSWWEVHLGSRSYERL